MDCQACELLQNSLKGVQRKRITNWRGYVYSLIRKVDESVYHEMKESKEKEKEENGTRRRSKKSAEENLLNPASAPSKKTLDKTATEFVPGKPWNTPEVVKAPEVAPKTLRKDAAEFVPTAQARAAQVAKAAAAAPLQAPLFAPMMPPPMPAAAAAMAFPDFGASSASWTAKKESPKKESKANGRAGITLKPDAQEFFPGVSAWAGAMVMPKQKAKAKPKTVRPRNPVDPGLVPSQPMSPGLQSGSRDADTAASSPSRSPVQAQDAVGSTDTTPAISKSCGDAFASQVSPKVVKVTKDCREISGVFTASECAVILSSAKALGFDAGAGRLVSKDPWLANALWQRLSPMTPYIINGKRVVGLQDDLVLQYGARSSSLEPSLAVQVCLKSSSSASEGHAYIVSTDSDGPVASWLIAKMQCQPSSWWTMMQAALGLSGPRSERQRMTAIMAVVTTGVTAALVTLLRRRQLRN